MVGYFDEKGNPRIKITVGGRKRGWVIDAFFDTGFSGCLVIPVALAVQSGLELIGVQPVKYADGRIVNQLVFKVLTKINDELKAVPATLTWEPQTLVGISLLKDYSITIDFKNKTIQIFKSV